MFSEPMSDKAREAFEEECETLSHGIVAAGSFAGPPEPKQFLSWCRENEFYKLNIDTLRRAIAWLTELEEEARRSGVDKTLQ